MKGERGKDTRKSIYTKLTKSHTLVGESKGQTTLVLLSPFDPLALHTRAWTHAAEYNYTVSNTRCPSVHCLFGWREVLYNSLPVHCFSTGFSVSPGRLKSYTTPTQAQVLRYIHSRSFKKKEQLFAAVVALTSHFNARSVVRVRTGS